MNATLTTSVSDAELIEQLHRLAGFVGNTPLYPLNRIFQKEGVQLYAKLEWQQMGGSVKARPAYNMIAKAILEGKLRPGVKLLDASSGNTAIAYATFARALGIEVTLVVPENASEARKNMLRALGAELILSSRFEGTDGAQRIAAEMATAYPDRYFYSDQYSNDNNWRAHYKHTAVEINTQTRGKITHFVAGLGTTGTFMGTGRRLRELNPNVELVALHPETAMHGLEGWKHLPTAKVPKFYDPSFANQNRDVSSDLAYGYIRVAARQEGLLLSPSSAAALAGAIQVAESLDQGVVVTVFPDNSDKYQEVLAHLFNGN
ncbi:MAG: pyridoxal-phosphate dependent enzyme [Bacteroidota bacterium]